MEVTSRACKRQGKWMSGAEEGKCDFMNLI